MEYKTRNVFFNCHEATKAFFFVLIAAIAIGCKTNTTLESSVAGGIDDDDTESSPGINRALLSFSSSGVEFGQTSVGATLSKEVNLLNNGSVAATLDGFAISGSNKDAFSASQSCGTSIKDCGSGRKGARESCKS